MWFPSQAKTIASLCVIVVQLDDMIAIGEDLYSPHRLEGRPRFLDGPKPQLDTTPALARGQGLFTEGHASLGTIVMVHDNGHSELPPRQAMPGVTHG